MAIPAPTHRPWPSAVEIAPGLFLVLALLSSLLLAWNLPPFQAPDELAQMLRADLLAQGRIAGERLPQADGWIAGGPADLVILDAHAPFQPIQSNLDARVNAADLLRVHALRWDGRVAAIPFPNTATYPPFFYLPQSAAIALGKLINLPVVQTLYLARAANAVSCSAIGFLALLLAGRARMALFTIMLLPMSVSLYAAVTQDGMKIVVAALGAALIGRAAAQQRGMRWAEMAGCSLCFALVGMSKPPFLLIGLLPLFAPRTPWRMRLAGSLLGVAPAAAWHGWMLLTVQTPLYRPDAPTDQAAQLAFLLAHPQAVPDIAIETLRELGGWYAKQFVGILGWLDVLLPHPYYLAAGLVLLLSLLWLLPLRADGRWALLVATAAIVLAIGAGIFAALYLAWTPVGHPRVEGVQGRYFLPLAVLVPLVLDQARTRPGLAERGIATIVLALPAISLLLVQRTIILRYYLD